MRTRRGLTLLEILISLLILGLGIAALASLFPLGIDMAAEADKDTQAALLAMSARSRIIAAGYVEKLAGDNFLGSSAGTNAFLDPGGGLTALDPSTDTGPSHALVIDPAGGTNYVRLATADRNMGTGEPDLLWAVGRLPRFPLFRQYGPNSTDFTTDITTGQDITRPCVDAVLRMELVADDTQVIENGWALAGCPDELVWQQADLEGTGRYAPAPRTDSGGSTVYDANGLAILQQNRHYSWMAVVQQPNIRRPRAFEIRVAVFRNRRFTLEAERRFDTVVVSTGQNPVVEIQWPLTDVGGTANLDETQAPEVRTGGYVLDAAARRGYFYRIAQVGPVTTGPAGSPTYFAQQLTLDAPLRDATNPQLVVMPGVAEVFESTFTLDE